MKPRDIQSKVDVVLDNLEKLNTLKAKSYKDKDYISQHSHNPIPLYRSAE